MEANQQSDLARLWEVRLMSGHLYEFVRSNSDQHRVSMFPFRINVMVNRSKKVFEFTKYMERIFVSEVLTRLATC